MALRFTSMSVAVVALAASVLPAHASGPYDGRWYVDAPAADQSQPAQETSGCEALRIPFTVTDNRVSGSLQHRRYGEGFEPGDGGPSAAPLIGTVQADGALTAEWDTRRFTGKLVGDKAELRWNGECGARVAIGSRAG
jgi:hypothetical protein